MSGIANERRWPLVNLKEYLKTFRFTIWSQSFFKCWNLSSVEHDAIYGPDYYQMVDETTGRSAEVMAHTIVEYLRPRRVIDMGCGTGNLIEALNSLQVETMGLEFAAAALKYCRNRKLNVRSFDFTDPVCQAQSFGEFDLAISMEVAIQLPPPDARKHIAFLCQHAPVVLFSSPPCANDRRPQSPQPAEYWIRAFSAHDFDLDKSTSETFKRCWQEKETASWFYREPMVFRRRNQSLAS